MPNARQWEDIISNPMSTPAQVAAAEGQLFKIQNPDRSTIVPVDLTATAQSIAEVAKPDYLPPSRIGLIVSSIDYTDPAEGHAAADAAAKLRCPEFDGPTYRAKQRQESADACLCTAAAQADADNRMKVLVSQNPTWNRGQLSVAYLAQSKQNTKFVMTDDGVEKRLYDDRWLKYEVVPLAIAPVAVPVAVAVPVPAPVPMRELSAENRALVDATRREQEMKRTEIEAQARVQHSRAMRELDREDAVRDARDRQVICG